MLCALICRWIILDQLNIVLKIERFLLKHLTSGRTSGRFMNGKPGGQLAALQTAHMQTAGRHSK